MTEYLSNKFKWLSFFGTWAVVGLHSRTLRWSASEDWTNTLQAVARDNICYDGEEIESLSECDNLWKSFEENLALLRYDVLAREKTEENPPNVASEHFENTLSDARCEVENLLEGWYEEVRKALPRWVRQLNRPNPDVRLMLNDKDSVFLTFNYTRTLEDLYGISDDVVLHVHGKDGDPWDGVCHNTKVIKWRSVDC